MKTINIKSKNQNKIKTFYNSDTNKYIGFAGVIQLYGDEFYVDTRDGTGYDDVFKKLKKLISYLAYKYNISGFTIDDAKQNIAVHILEGIPKFDPNKGTKLSTFLQMRINRRLINQMRDHGRVSKNPTILRTSLYKVICKCSSNFILALNYDESLEDKICGQCNENIYDAKIYAINRNPMPLSIYEAKRSKNVYKGLTLNEVISDNSFDIPMVQGSKIQFDSMIMYDQDLNKILEKEDLKIGLLIKLVCFEGYSVSEASKIVGLSHMGASKKLKRLKKNKMIKEMLDR